MRLLRNNVPPILKYLKEKGRLLRARELYRVVRHKGGLLRANIDTKQERKFGRAISQEERGEYFARIADQAKLSGKRRERFLRAVDGRHIKGTLDEAMQFAEKASPRPGEGAVGGSVHGADRLRALKSERAMPVETSHETKEHKPQGRPPSSHLHKRPDTPRINKL